MFSGGESPFIGIKASTYGDNCSLKFNFQKYLKLYPADSVSPNLKPEQFSEHPFPYLKPSFYESTKRRS